jgi:hypothetical protein
MRVVRTGRILRWCVGGLLVATLPGCSWEDALITVGVVGAVNVTSIVVIGRTPIDAIYSLSKGKDCSVVRLDEGKTYCRPIEPPPPPQPFCTRSLAVVNCWTDPANLPDHPPSVVDTPPVTAAQEAYRLRTWP